jgi:hypothetical protein
MDTYHGSSASAVSKIATGKVDVTLGGGELGRGFYTGQYLHEAKAWAFQRSGDRRRNVVVLSTPDTQVVSLVFEVLDYRYASLRRSQIKKSGETRTYLFGKDLVWAPIVGTTRASGDQFKWESQAAEFLLNGAQTIRKIV